MAQLNSSHCAVHPLSKNNVFGDRRNRLHVYGKSASLRCGGKLFHSPGLAAAKALSPNDGYNEAYPALCGA